MTPTGLWRRPHPTPSVLSTILGTLPPNTEHSRPTRPRFGNRAVSLSVSPLRRGKSTSRTRPGAMFASFNRPSPKREWSVFEQRMENEGQMRTRSILRESTSESTVPSPFQQTTNLASRSESPVPDAPSLRHVTVEDGHESDDTSTIGYDSESDSEDSSRPSTPISAPPPQKRRWYLEVETAAPHSTPAEYTQVCGRVLFGITIYIQPDSFESDNLRHIDGRREVHRPSQGTW
jgi:hypothetical protein